MRYFSRSADIYPCNNSLNCSRDYSLTVGVIFMYYLCRKWWCWDAGAQSHFFGPMRARQVGGFATEAFEIKVGQTIQTAATPPARYIL